MEKYKETESKGEKKMRGKYLNPNEELWSEIPKEFLTEQNTWRLLNRQEKALLSEGQLYSYERYWMSVTDNRILRQAAYKKGFEQGYIAGYEEVLNRTKAEGIQKGIYTVARNMKQMGLSLEDITKATGLSEKEIAEL